MKAATTILAILLPLIATQGCYGSPVRAAESCEPLSSALQGMAGLREGKYYLEFLAEVTGTDIEDPAALHQLACNLQGVGSLEDFQAVFGEEAAVLDLFMFRDMLANSGGFQGTLAGYDIELQIFNFLRQVSGSPEGSPVDMAVFREKLTREQLHKFISDLLLYYGADVLGDVNAAFMEEIVHTPDIDTWVTALMESEDAQDLSEATGFPAMGSVMLLNLISHVAKMPNTAEITIFRDFYQALSEIRLFYILN